MTSSGYAGETGSEPTPKEQPPGKPAVSAAAVAYAQPAIALDPFREVRTPERNLGPATIAGGIAVTPLARRLAGKRGIDLSRLQARMGASSRATWKAPDGRKKILAFER